MWISFLSWQHPYVYRVTFATANESSALLIRMFNEKGTLKDLIYKVFVGKVHALSSQVLWNLLITVLSTMVPEARP